MGRLIRGEWMYQNSFSSVIFAGLIQQCKEQLPSLTQVKAQGLDTKGGRDERKHSIYRKSVLTGLAAISSHFSSQTITAIPRLFTSSLVTVTAQPRGVLSEVVIADPSLIPCTLPTA